jgi:RNA polymerase sigma factor (sigma-70 family)
MTDSQIINGIHTNNPIVWRYICRNLKSPFIVMLKRFCLNNSLSSDDWEDIFQETCVILMENIKQGKFEERQGSTLFSYFVEIGKRTMQTVLRKKTKYHPVTKIDEGTPHIIPLWNKPASEPHEKGSEVLEISVKEKQTQQNEFLDRVFASIPDACKTLLKKFYWDHKPMDEIASILSLRNADTAKTKKNRCMNQFKDIAKKLIESDEYAEESVRACVERAVLRELLEDERIMMNDSSIKRAAFQTDVVKEDPEDK